MSLYNGDKPERIESQGRVMIIVIQRNKEALKRAKEIRQKTKKMQARTSDTVYKNDNNFKQDLKLNQKAV